MCFSLVNMPDPIQKRSLPVMAIMASMQPELGRVVYMPEPDFPASDSVLFFQRRPGSYCAKPAETESRPGESCECL